MATGAPTRREAIPAWLRRVLVLLALSVFLNYVDRTNLAVAASQLKEVTWIFVVGPVQQVRWSADDTRADLRLDTAEESLQ